jgi:putative ABC transport system permease protein
MKLIDIFKTAGANILQSPLRTFLTIIAVFVGAFTLTLTTGIGAGISQYIDSQVDSIGARNVLIVRAKSTSAGPLSGPQKYDPDKSSSPMFMGFGRGDSAPMLTDRDLATIKAESGVLDVTPQRFVVPSYIVGPNGQKYKLLVNEYVGGTHVAMNSGVVASNLSSVPQIVLPYNYVSTLGFSGYANAVNKNVTIGVSDLSGAITEISATVVGVAQKSLISSTFANINSALFDKLYNIQYAGLPNNIVSKHRSAIVHFDPSYSERQVRALKFRLNKDGYIGETFVDEVATLKQIVNGIVIVFDLFAGVALIAAGFGVINTLLMSVQERTKEIGLMKAMGMGRSRIFLLFSAEAVLLGFWGSFLGVLAAMGVGLIANVIASRGFLKDFEGLRLLAFPPVNVIGIIVGIMAVAFLAGALPARRAAGLDPIDALRYE